MHIPTTSPSIKPSKQRKAQPDMKKIAFAFEFQMFESVPFEVFDRQPEKIITEKRIII